MRTNEMSGFCTHAKNGNEMLLFFVLQSLRRKKWPLSISAVVFYCKLAVSFHKFNIPIEWIMFPVQQELEALYNSFRFLAFGGNDNCLPLRHFQFLFIHGKLSGAC